MSVSHARCCLLMLKTAALYRCALCMFCCLPVVYVLGCVLVRGQQKRKTFYRSHTYVQKGLIQRNPVNRLIHARREKTLRVRHASYSARTELKPQPQVPDGLPVSTYLGFWLKVLVRRDIIQNRRIFHKYTCTYEPRDV